MQEQLTSLEAPLSSEIFAGLSDPVNLSHNPAITTDPLTGQPIVTEEFSKVGSVQTGYGLELAKAGFTEHGESAIRCRHTYRTTWYCRSGHMEYVISWRCRLQFCEFCGTGLGWAGEFKRKRTARQLDTILDGPRQLLILSIPHSKSEDVEEICSRQQEIHALHTRWMDQQFPDRKSGGAIVAMEVNPKRSAVRMLHSWDDQRDWRQIRESWRAIAGPSAQLAVEYSHDYAGSEVLLTQCLSGKEPVLKMSPGFRAELHLAFMGFGTLVQPYGTFRGGVRSDTEADQAEGHLIETDSRSDGTVTVLPAPTCDDCHESMVRVEPHSYRNLPARLTEIKKRCWHVHIMPSSPKSRGHRATSVEGRAGP